jgi:regulatory protein
MDRALRLLSFKSRTVKEMRERLLEKDWTDEPTVAQVITRLEELALLNDEQFATSFASSSLTIKPIGRVRLRRDLQRKKLPPQTVETALDAAFDERSEEELIQQAIEKRIRLKGVPKSQEEAKKLFEFLMRRGFQYDLIRQKIREIDRKIDIDEES